MTDHIQKIKNTKRCFINYGYCEVIACEGNIATPGISLDFKPSVGAIWEYPGCCNPFHIYRAYDEGWEVDENKDVQKWVKQIDLDLSVNDAELLVELLLSFPLVKAARDKRLAENSKPTVEELTPVTEKSSNV